MGAPAPGSRTEVLIPSKCHLIPLRGIGGGMGIRTPDLLIANETLYQLSYTPNLIDFSELHDNLRSKKDACLYRHEINGNYYAYKENPQQDQNPPSPLGKARQAAITDRKLVNGNCANGSFGSG